MTLKLIDAPEPKQAVRMRCLEIAASDIERVITLLCEGFAKRDAAFWRRGLQILALRNLPEGRPRFGYMLETDGEIVGVILLIFAPDPQSVDAAVRCNVSSWYVKPAYRAFAALLILRALKAKDVTYLNISPAPNTWSILNAQGYKRYVEGLVMSIPAIGLGFGRVSRIERYDALRHAGALPTDEAVLMADHQKMGCIALLCRSKVGLLPFVFRPRSVRILPVPALQLIFCRDTADFVRLSAPLGRWLLAYHGAFFVMLDAAAPITGLTSRFIKDRNPKYYRGPVRPRINDLAYTEAVIFGV